MKILVNIQEEQNKFILNNEETDGTINKQFNSTAYFSHIQNQ